MGFDYIRLQSDFVVIIMSRAQLSQNIHCPIPVALPRNEGYDAGVPVFGINRKAKHWNRERYGEMFTAWNMDNVKVQKPIPVGSDVTFLGVTTENTLGQTVCSVQGAGVVNVKASCFDSSAFKNKMSITNEIFAFYDQTKRKLTKFYTQLIPGYAFIKIGTVHHVYPMETHNHKIHSVDVRLHTGRYRILTQPFSAAVKQVATPSAQPAATSSGGSGSGSGSGSGAAPVVLPVATPGTILVASAGADVNIESFVEQIRAAKSAADPSSLTGTPSGSTGVLTTAPTGVPLVATAGVFGAPLLAVGAASGPLVASLGGAGAGFINDAEAEADLGAASSAEEPEEEEVASSDSEPEDSNDEVDNGDDAGANFIDEAARPIRLRRARR